uniref:CopY n=1 Tax=Bhargavaea cecembensis TaxID=394098 RepID=G3GHX7_9BACL|nr:CopY [Bhargavaea cecembensis]
MSVKTDFNVTDSEWEVMRVVWAHGQASSKEIIDVLGQKMDWKPATTKTFLGRLVNKGMLSTETEGRRYLYSAMVGESEFVRHALDEFFSHVCNREVGRTIEDVLSKATLSHRDIDVLQAILDEKKETAVEEVPCNCIPGQCHCSLHGNDGCGC